MNRGWGGEERKCQPKPLIIVRRHGKLAQNDQSEEFLLYKEHEILVWGLPADLIPDEAMNVKHTFRRA